MPSTGVLMPPCLRQVAAAPQLNLRLPSSAVRSNSSVSCRTLSPQCSAPRLRPNAQQPLPSYRNGHNFTEPPRTLPGRSYFTVPEAKPLRRHAELPRHIPHALSQGTATPADEATNRADEDLVAGFDPSAPPPFTLADLRSAIPKHCFVKDPIRSLFYFVLDVALVAGLAAAAYAAAYGAGAWLTWPYTWLMWPVYWFAQGVAMSALFVVGHECDHGSFSDSKLLNDIIGHLSHTPLLTPFHGWRISHRTHHTNHGHAENDESWHPLNKDTYDKLTWWKTLRFQLPLPLFAFPVYIWARSPGKTGSHFHPSSPIFQPKERGDVLLSAGCWWAMLLLLVGCTVQAPMMMVNLYWIPYMNHIAWLAGVTYLHHHAHDEKLPWYRGSEWSYLRGALTTLDRDYGVIKVFTHDIGTHVVHHLFPQMPHYHLLEATEAIKPVLGEYYREPEPCKGPLPFHLIPTMLKSFSQDHYVPAQGNVVFYEKDESLPTWWWRT